jgi:glutathione peroxidase
MTSVFDFNAYDIDGHLFELQRLREQVLLIVNAASECRFSPQYHQLVQLQKRYRDRGFCVLAFPCNQFAKQEPADALGIKMFCTQEYGVDFPLFDKIHVNGPGTHPLFMWLKSQKPGVLFTKRIKWNFTKFLCNREGQVVSRHAPMTEPEQLAPMIERLLANKATDSLSKAA